eukprot:8569509-Ditylum_brightwellii.AAC.1
MTHIGLQEYFDKINIINKGGYTYPSIRIGFNMAREAFENTAKFDLKQEGIQLWQKNSKGKHSEIILHTKLHHCS